MYGPTSEPSAARSKVVERWIGGDSAPVAGSVVAPACTAMVSKRIRAPRDVRIRPSRARTPDEERTLHPTLRTRQPAGDSMGMVAFVGPEYCPGCQRAMLTSAPLPGSASVVCLACYQGITGHA